MSSTHDPEALRRRLARYFDAIPHLAYVGVDSSARGVECFTFALDFTAVGADGRAWLGASDEVSRLLWRAARLLGIRCIRHGDSGPPPWERVIYVRDQMHPVWGEWDAEQRRFRDAALCRAGATKGGAP